jgi:signal transduction histidine kinase
MQEKAESHRLEQTLSTVSHELKPPLNAINGITHLLLEEKLPPKITTNHLSSLTRITKPLLYEP